jgi:N-acetylglucosaminyl-diphospho-decaprenol L-rhamnosyltransferase
VTQLDLTVVVVTYRSADFIVDCLATVTAARHTIEIVVADNDSPDDTVAVVRAARPDVTVVETGGNLGFATAVNVGVAAGSGRHVLLLNPDTEVRPGALDALVDALDTDAALGIVAPRLLNTDGTDQGTARMLPTPAAAVFGRRSPLTRAFPGNRWSRRYLIGLDRDGSGAFDVEWVSGACLMSPRALFESLDGLDEGFFMHFEDADYCRRVLDAGRRVRCIPSAEVVHAEGGCRQGWPADQVRHFHHGAYRYWSKNHAPGRRNPLRVVAATSLAARAAGIIARDAIRERRSHRASPAHTLEEGAR